MGKEKESTVFKFSYVEQERESEITPHESQKKKEKKAAETHKSTAPLRFLQHRLLSCNQKSLRKFK